MHFEISNNVIMTNAVGGIALENSGDGLVEKNTVLRAWNDDNTSGKNKQYNNSNPLGPIQSRKM